jgi:hypothetical protein
MLMSLLGYCFLTSRFLPIQFVWTTTEPTTQQSTRCFICRLLVVAPESKHE